MTLVISIVALLIAVAAVLIPLLDKDLRRAYIFVKHSKALDNFKGEHLTYNEYNIPLRWYGTVYHLKNDLVNMATHTLNMFYSEMKEVTEAVFYVNLKDYQCISENTYKLLIEDPHTEAWTHYIKLDREFVEANLDKLVRVEAEIVSKETDDGVIFYQESTQHKLIIKPMKVEATGIPTLLHDFGRR
ncbi:MAG: hypothetical protein JEZ08_16525 [Clostridiales bacterium]|nr:hypothetical protein [Clostridiales bacterium]